MLLCSPHNPVGRVWSKTELNRLLTIAQRHDLVILSDEIHADLVYPENRHTTLSLLAENSANIVTAVAPSKTFNIPGLNLSALIVQDPKRRASIVRAFDTVHVSASNPFSVAAFEAAYRGRGVAGPIDNLSERYERLCRGVSIDPPPRDPSHQAGGDLPALVGLQRSCKVFWKK